MRLSHFVPENHPQIHPGMSDEVRGMMPFLVERSPKGWTKIPNHGDLEVFASRKVGVPVVGFRKEGKEVSIHVFCNEVMDPIDALQIVISLYTKFKLGMPAFSPDEPNWIHTIPIPGTALSQGETILTHQIMQSLFWTIHHDYKRHKGVS